MAQAEDGKVSERRNVRKITDSTVFIGLHYTIKGQTRCISYLNYHTERMR